MSVHVASVFMLPCAGGYLELGLIPVRGDQPTAHEIHNFRLILLANRQEGPMLKVHYIRTFNIERWNG
jgi:hypothetical protein